MPSISKRLFGLAAWITVTALMAAGLPAASAATQAQRLACGDGSVIDRVDIAQTGSNAILIENCHNVNIAAQSGTVTGPGDIRPAARSEFPHTSDIVIQNLRVTNSAITENPCGVNTTFRNNTLVNSRQNIC